MKIGILTQPLRTNYGGLLQNYALQQILISAGYDVETIDWIAPENLYNKLYRIKMKIYSTLCPSKYRKPTYLPNQKEMAIICHNTNYFISSYIKHTEIINTLSGFQNQAQRGQYNVYIVGSDQCWRPCYNVFLSSMFLDFVQDKDVKRIAYAASFGTDKWEFTPKQTEICSSLVQNFELVTVREDSGVELCKQYLNVNAIQVLDPTMLLTKNEYIKLIEKEKEPKNAGTLFDYILDPSEKKLSLIHSITEYKRLKSFRILPKCQTETRTRVDVKKHINDCVYPSVTAWLRAFMDAEMTIVDSFHGMVFSIIFNKPFWVIGNIDRGMSRFTSLLKVFHLEDRLLDEDHIENIDFSKPIDWDNVNRILEIKRNECKSLLLNTISK